jgi:MYXO-CTERM domain-containing protein
VAPSDDFTKGVAVGAGLVLLGVLAGGLLGRRR